MLLYHLRHAFRRLLREPGFTAAAVLTLGLGVGANVAVFTVVEGLLLRPLPYRNGDQLVTVRHRDDATGNTKAFVAIGDFIDLKRLESSFETIGSYGTMLATVFGEGEPYQVAALTATPEVLEILDFRPAVGRGFTAEESLIGSASVAILGHDLWRTRFGSDPAVIGRSIRLDNGERTIVGVAPAGFRFPPQAATGIIVNNKVPAQSPANRKAGWTFALGRLEAGRTLADATVDLARVSSQMAAEFPDQNRGSTYYVQSLRDATLGSTKTPLILLLAAVGVVLLIACANVANLLLARSLGRRRELAVRMTLGAGRKRLVGQLLAESFALSLVAGAVGLALAGLGTRALVSMIPKSAQPPDLGGFGINLPVLAFALGVVVLTALGCGVVAALSAPMENAAQHFVGSGKTTISAGARRATATLVVAEVALAVVLLFGAGLILRSFAGLVAVNPGFQIERVLTMNVAIPPARYQEVEAREGFWQRAFTSIRAIPGVEEVGVAAVTPLTGNNWTSPFERADQPVPPGERPPEVGWQAASGGYFSSLRIPLISGRVFDHQDRPNTPPVVIVSEAVEKRFFPGGSALGQRIRLGEQTAEIVGVVGDIRRTGLRDEPWADLYFPFERGPGMSMTAFIRTSSDPESAIAPVRAALREIEPDVVIANVTPLAEVAAESIRDTRLLLRLLGVFAATALLLAAVGIYAVMAYLVRQRTREIGTRIALGASRSAIVWMVMRQGGAIAGLGIVIGLTVAALASRTLQSLLFGVSTYDPAVIIVAITVLVGTTISACFVPARRAARIDPARTLQEE